MCSVKTIDIISDKIVEAYRTAYGSNIKSILLYGSYARGDYDTQSDIDIVAIVVGERVDLQNKLKQVWDEAADVGLDNDVVISPAVIPYDDYEKYKRILPYYINISKEGKVIG
ncbi:MAG: nucleotidyltransferase domain-containing protein [Lachnospiraceae bacterium]|nr:nucleotidyltransferase domain-containing protein [Lachnospiraceae bacterium]